MLLLSTVALASIATGLIGGPAQGAGPRSPLHGFVENVGQWPEGVRFVGRANGVEVQVREDAVWILGRSSVDDSGTRGGRVDVLRVEFVGSGVLEAKGTELLPGRVNFLQPSQPLPLVGVRRFGSVRCEDVVHGVDWFWTVDPSGAPRFDFEVDAGVPAGAIQLSIEGGRSRVAGDGSLLVDLGTSSFRLGAPHGQVERQTVPTSWSAVSGGLFGFEVVGRSVDEALRIDPTVVYSTFVGASGFDDVNSVARWGNEIIVGGETLSPTFPTSPGAFDQDLALSGFDAYLLRFDLDESSLKFSTFLGDSTPFSEKGTVVVGVAGEDSVVAFQSGSGHPTTEGAYVTPVGGARDLVVARFGPMGDSPQFVARLGGSAWEWAREVEIAPDGRIRVSGTGSRDLPTATTVLSQKTEGTSAGYLVELAADGSSVERSVKFNGGWASTSIYDFELLGDGRVLIGGEVQSGVVPTTADAFQTETAMAPGVFGSDGYWMLLDPSWSTVEYASMLSSTTVDYLWKIEALGPELFWLVFTSQSGQIPFPASVDLAELAPGLRPWLAMLFDVSAHEVVQARWVTDREVRDVARDADGGLVFTTSGLPAGPFPPLSPGDAFGPPGTLNVAKLDPMGEQFVQVHAFGASDDVQYAYDARITGPEELLVGGRAFNDEMPVTEGAVDPTVSSNGEADGFVTIFDLTPDGLVRYGTNVDGCNGECRIGVRALPIAGSGEFGLSCVGAPRSGAGSLVIGFDALELPLAGGAQLLVDPTAALLIPSPADAVGRAAVDLPLTTVPAGASAHFQFVWLDLGECGAFGSTYSSDALALTLQAP